MEGGQYKKAIPALSSAGVAQATDDVVAEMLVKHPQAGPPSIPSDLPRPPLLVMEMDVVRALRSFPKLMVQPQALPALEPII